MAATELPLPIKVHAVNTLAMGASLVFFPAAFLNSAPVGFLARIFNVPTATNATLSLTDQQHWTNVGLLMVAVGSLYLPFWSKADPKFVHFSIRLRLGLAGLVGLLWFTKPELKDVFKAGLLLEDGLSALIASFLVR